MFFEGRWMGRVRSGSYADWASPYQERVRLCSLILRPYDGKVLWFISKRSGAPRGNQPQQSAPSRKVLDLNRSNRAEPKLDASRCRSRSGFRDREGNLGRKRSALAAI
jgi:hypothetical protein